MGRIVYHYRVTCYRRVAGRRDTQQGQHARETHARLRDRARAGPRARAATVQAAPARPAEIKQNALQKTRLTLLYTISK